MPIFHHNTRGRVLFVHIPKTGGSSIEHWLRTHGYGLDKFSSWEGGGYQHATQQIYSAWGEFDYEFTVVRHPLQRFVSILGYLGIPKDGSNAHALYVLKEFDKDNSYLGNHVRPQVQFISDKTEVFKFEDDFFPKIGSALSLPGPFPHVNKKRTNVELSDLSEQVIKRLRELYREDFQRFGYQ